MLLQGHMQKLYYYSINVWDDSVTSLADARFDLFPLSEFG